MIVNAATDRALELIEARAADARKAFTPGAIPHFGDTETASPASREQFDPLSVSAPGNDYFVTTDERGRLSYSRNGAFELREGTLCTGDGRPVRGFVDGGATKELRVDRVDLALGRVANLRVESDGVVSYDRTSIEPRSATRHVQRIVVGRLALARFPAASRAVPAEGGGVRVPGVDPHVGCAGDGNFGAIAPMRRESSRIDLDASLDKLHDAYVAFDALTAAHRAEAKTVMDLLK
jgi:flagellar hook protein FlgE